MKGKSHTVIVALLLLNSLCFAQWKECNQGLDGGSVAKLTVLGDTLFAMSTYGGVYRSSDLGQHWTQKNSGLEGVPWMTTIIATGSELIVGTRAGIYVSTDAAETWLVTNGPTNTSAIAFATSLIYAGTQGSGMYESADSARSWFPAGLTGESLSVIQPLDSLVFAGTEHGLYVTGDSARNWTSLKNGFDAQDTSIKAIAISGSTVYVGTSAGGVYRSNDKGQHWEKIIDGLPLSNAQVNCIATKDSDVYLGTSAGLFVLQSQTSSWLQRGNGVLNSAIFDIHFAGTAIVIGCQGSGCYVSFDGATSWTQRNSGLTVVNISSVFENDNYLFACSAGSGVYRSSDHGASWTQKVLGLKSPIVLSGTVLGSKLFIASSAGVYVSSDNGDNWYVSSALIDAYTYSVIARDGNLFASTTKGVFGSNDSGASWTEIGFHNTNVPAIAVNGTDMYCISGNSPQSNYQSTFNYSPDFGSSWSPFTSSLTGLVGNMMQFIGDTLFVGTQGGLYTSTDHQQSFRLISSSLVDVSGVARKGSYLLMSGGTILSAFFSRFYDNVAKVSTDFGLHWIDLLSQEMTNKRILRVAFHDNYVIAGTLGSGVYRLALSDLQRMDVPTIEEVSQSLISPNPCCDLARIHCQDDEFELRVFNCLGREVLSIKNQKTLDFSFLPSGSYSCSVKSKNVQLTSRFVIIK